MTENNAQYKVLVAVYRQENLWPLLSLAYALAKSHQGQITLLHISQMDQSPEWLKTPAVYENIPIEIEVVQSSVSAKAISAYVRKNSPNLLLIGWTRRGGEGTDLLGTNMDTILRHVPCDVAVVKASPNWPEVDFARENRLKILTPAAGGPNAPLAIELGLSLSKHSQTTALYIATEDMDEANLQDHQEEIAAITYPWRDNPQLGTKIARAESILKGILAEAKDYDITLVGASREDVFSQLIFGNIPTRTATQNEQTTIIVRRFSGGVGNWFSRVWWQSTHFLPSLSLEERTDVYKQIRRGARPKIDFFMMIALAAGIATLGLMANSPAVIIGAMLVAPLMSAIMGLGMGVIQGDLRLLRLSSIATFNGVLLALGMGVLFGILLPEPASDTIPSEILGRTAPTLFDLGVALVSGLAGAYALSRKDVSSSLPGVAIAAALVPPLAVAGIGLAWQEWVYAGGAFLLFTTNLIAITAASALIFFILGFRPTMRKERTNVFIRSLIASSLLLVIIATILGVLSYQAKVQTDLEIKIADILDNELEHLQGETETIAIDQWTLEATDGITLNLILQIRSTKKLSSGDAFYLQNRLVQDLKQPLALSLSVLETTALEPLEPPPTPLPNSPTLPISPVKPSSALLDTSPVLTPTTK